MKKLNLILGIVCVVLGLIMFLISVPFAIILILIGAFNIFLYFRAKNKPVPEPVAEAAEPLLDLDYDELEVRVAGFDFYQDELKELLYDENYEYTLSPKDFKEEVFQRTYQYLTEYYPAKIVPEPENEHDPNALAVFVEGVRIGYIPRKDQNKVNAFDTDTIEAEIYGGKYKELDEDDKIITGETPYKALLHFKSKPKV